ncbi:MAG: hypothetical protein LBU34_05405 [Planctomycetaceae bacterium]|jgi:hypothetical protein|nr:hypothetical protein [Planctomycetaceae bacterium]
MTIIYKQAGLFLFFMSLTLSGCSYLYTVEGRITFEDGTPLTIGTILFEDDGGGYTAHGTIDTKGHYSVNRIRHGVNRIYILGAVQVSHEKNSVSNNRHNAKQHIEQLIDMKYRSPETSGLICKVDGNMTHNIIVTKPKIAETSESILSE